MLWRNECVPATIHARRGTDQILEIFVRSEPNGQADDVGLLSAVNRRTRTRTAESRRLHSHMARLLYVMVI